MRSVLPFLLVGASFCHAAKRPERSCSQPCYRLESCRGKRGDSKRTDAVRFHDRRLFGQRPTTINNAIASCGANQFVLPGSGDF